MSTLRSYRRLGSREVPLKPPMITSFYKAQGSRKLGRAIACGDRSAVFDLPKKTAKRLLEAIQAEDKTLSDEGLEFGLEIPSSLPKI